MSGGTNGLDGHMEISQGVARRLPFEQAVLLTQTG